MQTGSTARAAGFANATVTKDDLAQFGDGVGRPASNVFDDFVHASGLNDFEILNLPQVGATTRLVAPQLEAIPADPVYRKFFGATGWQDFVEDGTDLLSSAPGSGLGVCPPAGDAAYTAGLTPGHTCLQITITDGGPNDADGNLNGVIKDPGGVCATGAGAEVRTGLGAVSPWWLVMLGLTLVSRLCSRERRVRFTGAADKAAD